MLPCTPRRDSQQLPLYTPTLGSQTQQGRLQGGKVPLPPPPALRAHLAGRWVLRTRFLLSRVRRAGQVRTFPGATCPQSKRPLESPAGGGSRAYVLAPRQGTQWRGPGNVPTHCSLTRGVFWAHLCSSSSLVRKPGPSGFWSPVERSGQT